MPHIEVIVPWITSLDTVPSDNNCPSIINIEFIVVCITKKAMTADNTATPFSFFAIPKETPAAKINGKSSNIALATFFKISIKE